MPNLTTVTLTNGTGTGGTGTVSTLDNVIGTAGTPSAQVQTIQGVASMTPVQVSQATAANLNATIAGTVSVNALPTGTNTIGSVKITDGTNTVTVNPNGRTTPSNAAPVVLASQTYNTVAASQTAQVLGSTGATGDWLDFIVVIPATTSPGNILLLDNATSITVFTGGASSVSSLIPFSVPIRAVSKNGAWKLTTGTNVSAIASGNFT